jgi:hypothetical protein
MPTNLPQTTGALIRRAWVVLGLATVAFATVVGVAVSGAYVYGRSAMEPREGVLETAGEVLLQPRNETRFKQVRGGEPVREGDTIKTPVGVSAKVILFDGTQLALAEGALVTLDEVSATRFVASEKRIQVSQREGWARLVVPPLRDYQVGRYTTLVNGLVVEAVSAPDLITDVSVKLRPLVETADSMVAGQHEALISVQSGLAAVRQGADSLVLPAGQALVQGQAARLSPARPLPLDFVRNGTFQALSVGPTNIVWPEHWRETRDQGGDGGELWGTGSLVYEDVDGLIQPVVVFDRRLNARDNAVIGIQQPLNLPLGQFRSLRLRLLLQVRHHSLSGGGVADSEYPIIVKVTYRDRQNRAVAWYRGFYTHNEQKLPVPNGVKVEQDEWVDFTQDLLRLSAKAGDGEPVLLETLDIYASGHDFAAAVASVAIEGE